MGSKKNTASKNRGGNTTNNIKKAPPGAKNIETAEKQNLLEMIVTNTICILLFVAFGFVAITGFFSSAVIDPNQYINEVIIFQVDNIVLNLFFTVLFVLFVFKMKKHYDFFARVNMRVMEVVLTAFTAVLGFIWIFSVTSIPAADSYNLYETASLASKGIYTPFINGSQFYNSAYYNGHSYFNFYPFQLGYVFLSELVYRVFGSTTAIPMQVINVICVSLAYLGIAKITKLLFMRKSVEFISIIMLACCVQPILFCTFTYGNIIGMCCAIWASFFLIRYFKTEEYIHLLPCGVLLVVSTVAKYNNLIYLIAFVVLLIVHTVKRKKWQSIAFALALCLAVVGSGKLIIMSYESRANVKLEQGISQTLYLDMGINDSYMAPGWYNAIPVNLYKSNNFNMDAANAQASADIKARLGYFAKNPGKAAEFFGGKIISQWNETTFESIWVSKVKGHYEEINGIGKAVYEGSLGQFIELYCGFYIQIMYILFVIGIILLLRRKSIAIEFTVLLLAILGGFGYHTLFEGKSQYILTYIILLIPYCAYALNSITDMKFEKIRKFIGNLKSIPNNHKAKRKT